MIDEPLPAAEHSDAEPTPPAETVGGDAPDPMNASSRAAEPPPDPDDGRARDRDDGDRGPDGDGDHCPDDGETRDREREPADDGADPDASDRDADEPETLEYRLERLRLLRAVVTLAVVVARLIRSL